MVQSPRTLISGSRGDEFLTPELVKQMQQAAQNRSLRTAALVCCVDPRVTIFANAISSAWQARGLSVYPIRIPGACVEHFNGLGYCAAAATIDMKAAHLELLAYIGHGGCAHVQAAQYPEKLPPGPLARWVHAQSVGIGIIDDREHAIFMSNIILSDPTVRSRIRKGSLEFRSYFITKDGNPEQLDPATQQYMPLFCLGDKN